MPPRHSLVPRTFDLADNWQLYPCSDLSLSQFFPTLFLTWSLRRRHHETPWLLQVTSISSPLPLLLLLPKHKVIFFVSSILSIEIACPVPQTKIPWIYASFVTDPEIIPLLEPAHSLCKQTNTIQSMRAMDNFGWLIVVGRILQLGPPRLVWAYV